jgi:hypothetical protein
MSKVIEYHGFILSLVQENGDGFRVAIAHADGRIFSMGQALSRCFYTGILPAKEAAMEQARSMVDDNAMAG